MNSLLRPPHVPKRRANRTRVRESYLTIAPKEERGHWVLFLAAAVLVVAFLVSGVGLR